MSVKKDVLKARVGEFQAHSAFAARPRTSPGPASTPVLHAAASRLTTPHAHPRQGSQGAGPPPTTHQLDSGARRLDNFLKGIKSFYRAQQPEFATEVDKILSALVHDCGGLGNERLPWLMNGIRIRGDIGKLPPPSHLVSSPVRSSSRSIHFPHI